MVLCCRFFCFLLPNVVLGVVALGIKREPVLGVEVALGVGVVPGSLLVVDGGVGAVMLVGVVPGALLLVETVAAVVVVAVRGAEKPVRDEWMWMEVALPIPDRQMMGAELMSWDEVFLPQS